MAQGRGFDPEAALRRHFEGELEREKAAEAAREVPPGPPSQAEPRAEGRSGSLGMAASRFRRLPDLAAAAVILALLGSAILFERPARGAGLGEWDSIGIEAAESFLRDCGKALGRAAEEFSSANAEETRNPGFGRFR